MAHATSFDTVSQPEQRSDRLVVVGVDRSKQFRRASRHTLWVRAMRVLLPTFAITSAGLYAVSAIGTIDFSGSLAPILPQILPENLTMQNPHYEGYTDDGGAYQVRASNARQEFDKPHIINLESISGVLTDAKKVKTDLTAAKGMFDTRQNVLELDGGITIASEDGMQAKLKTATVKTKAGHISSNDPVEVRMPGGLVKSDKVSIWQKKKLVVFSENVQTKLTPAANEKAAKSAQGSKKAATSPALLGASNEPVNIDSAVLRIDRAKGDAVFQGQVKAVQGDQSLLTAELIVEYEDANAADKAEAAARLGGNGSSIKAIIAPKPVMMRRGENEQVTGQSAHFDIKNNKAKISGSVVMSAGPQRKAVADVAEIDSKADTITLEGNVVVSQGQNELHGQRLFVNRALGTSQMSTPVGNNGKRGRITAKLQREKAASAGTGKAAGKSKAARLAKAAKAKPGAIMSMTAFKSDSGSPTQVEADVLDVNDKLKQAVFRGNVEVEQGQISMRSNELTAHYSGDSSLLTPVEPAASKKPGAGSRVTRILARGKVFINSRTDGQTASGDWADFDMKNNIVKLGGDVVLNQGKNVIKATSLKIDIETGNAVIERTPDQPGTASWVSSLSKTGVNGTKTVPLRPAQYGRPSAVFYPTQLSKSGPAKAKPKKPPKARKVSPKQAPRPAKASSWGTSREVFEQ